MDEKSQMVGETDTLLASSASFKRALTSSCTAYVCISLAMLTSVVCASLLIACAISGSTISGSSRSVARPLQVLDKPLVILVSSDGFRWGYQWKLSTPNIDRIRLNGTEAYPGLIPVYPSVTFPNHYSIATGLYPAWHGIINNQFRNPDPSVNDRFYMGNLNPKWWLGEPIWETVVNNGLEAAIYFWVGSEVRKGNWTCPPESCPQFNSSVPFETRVDTVLDYIDRPNRPSFIALYFEEPDEEGHKFGPDSPQIEAAIGRIDSMIGRLLDGLEKRKILDDVHVIMVGDHGMAGTCDQRLIFLDDLSSWIQIPKEWVDTYSPILSITPPKDVDPRTVVRKMKDGLASGKVKNGEFLKVYLKEELPSRLHYSGSERIQPIIGIVAEGYKVEGTRANEKQECGGAHGYDNTLMSMRSVFFGRGPRFARGRQVPSFVNVEIYNIITEILGIPGAENNGTKSFPETILLPKY